MKIKKLVDSFNYAIEGIIYTIKTQRNIRIELIIAALVLIFSAITEVSRLETIAIIFAIMLVIMAELFNTAIETVVDLISQDYHPLAAIAKNVSAGAVLVSAINSVLVGYLVFYDKLTDIAIRATREIEHLPMHITVIALFIITLVVIILKTFGKKGSYMQGGMPSGHSALSMSLCTAIVLLSENPIISLLSIVLTFLVMQSRYEFKIHTIWEIVAGALIGVLLTILIFQIIVNV